MIGQIALALSFTLSLWLLIGDTRRRRSVSAAVWVPVALLLIIGSRSPSEWLAGGRSNFETGALSGMGNDVAASPVDTLFFALVILAAFMIASQRGVSWMRMFQANTAILFFYIFFALSVIWSGDPMGSFKRIVKDFGLLFVIAVIYSERNPLDAMRAVFVRCAFVLFPLSVVLIKYYPDIGREYAVAGDVLYTGVTVQKNSLGELILVLTLFLLWDVLEMRRANEGRKQRRWPWAHLLMLLLGLDLLRLSQSKTATMCLVVGAVLLLRKGALRSVRLSRLSFGAAMALPFLLFFSQQFQSIIAPVIEAMGRNMTFTGRTDIWDHITLQTVNPLFGAGYWNFWGGPRGFAIAEQMKTTIPNAHCGYIDIYLDGGLCGLVLLAIVLFTAGHKILHRMASSADEDRFLLMRHALLCVVIIYNLFESTYARMMPLWFTTLLLIVDFPPASLPHRVASSARKAGRRLSPKPVQAIQTGEL